MAKTWFTADTHFGHRGLLKESMHCRRDLVFSSVEEMDAVMIANWNATVGPKDTVFHLGDFAYRCSLEYAQSVFSKLRGRKVLIWGNHEQRGKRLAWDAQHQYLEVTVDDKDLILFHYALRTWNKQHWGALHLYGHSHGGLRGDEQSTDVGVDCWGFAPVSLDRILKRMDGTEDEEVLQACA
ncbi:metallophosphoesterase [Microvirga sp. Mcv34]|uniref:metallophosphoesterase n=1 Tax=Microvirga sp. Mcv34 TaxID=2926016 RepID=UPI0021C68FAC|nr:metallophosphoesterase [Microvirga sp. Mcv34]